jgi:nicotinamidase-related amidase
MTRLSRLPLCLLLAALVVLPGGARAVAQAPANVQMPPVPAPVAVSLDASTTAFLALDFNTTICGANPTCVATLPAVASGITAARAAGALVVYSTTGAANPTPLVPDVMQGPSDPIVVSGADKFLNTNLDDVLKQNGITTVVITGTVTNGAVLFTGFSATARGYTVVIAEDGVSARSDFATSASEWQSLNGPGGNTQNTPLQAKAATLSRTDLITYK